MPENVGTQIVSLIHYSTASSPNVNRRHQDIRQLGIYQGGRLDVVDGETKAAALSVLICEISDGTYQVKVETTEVISFTAVAATPYVVLRWAYTGASSDFVERLSVATPAAGDIIVGKCTFGGGGDLQGFDYGDDDYPRSTPNTQDLFLKVEPTEDTELKIRVRVGRMHSNTGVVIVPDQKSTVLVAPSANSRIYLLYIDTDGTVSIDSSGAEAASPTAPDYDGRIVLAEITLASTDTNITAAKIRDVRNYMVSGSKIERYLATYNGSIQQVGNGVFTKADLGTIKNQNNMAVSSNRITLAANRKYALSYSVTAQPTASSVADPSYRAKWVVVSGDTSWDLETISLTSAECGEAARQADQIATTIYIIPSSETVIELQVYTEGSSSEAQIISITTNVMAIDN